MIFYKIPLNADLSGTSYRVFVLLYDCAFVEFNEGNIEDDWIEYTEEQIIDEYGYNIMDNNQPEQQEEPAIKPELPQQPQIEYISREDFDLLDITYSDTMYYITEENGMITMKRGEE